MSLFRHGETKENEVKSPENEMCIRDRLRPANIFC